MSIFSLETEHPKVGDVVFNKGRPFDLTQFTRREEIATNESGLISSIDRANSHFYIAWKHQPPFFSSENPTVRSVYGGVTHPAPLSRLSLAGSVTQSFWTHGENNTRVYRDFQTSCWNWEGIPPLSPRPQMPPLRIEDFKGDNKYFPIDWKKLGNYLESYGFQDESDQNMRRFSYREYMIWKVAGWTAAYLDPTTQHFYGHRRYGNPQSTSAKLFERAVNERILGISNG